MKRSAMKVVASVCLFLLLALNYSGAGYLTTHAMVPPLVFNNVLDFDNQEFVHISFDPADERAAESIVQKFGNISSFSISGGLAAIRPGTDYAGNFPGEGTEGGAVSGDYRVDWGYFERSTVTITFITAVDAVGAFYGGNNVAGGSQLIVTLADGSTFATDGAQAGLANVTDFLPSPTGECTAINGFLGVDSNGGPRIVKAVFTTSNDAASLDSIFYGNANGGSHGPGVTGFAKNPFGPQCTAAGFSPPPRFPAPFMPPCAATPAAAAHWWPANGNTDDIIGGKHGTLVNGTSYAEGKVGQAFSFDGIDDIFVTPLTFTYESGVTFELWVKTTDSDGLVMSDGGGASAGAGMGLFLTDGRIDLFGTKGTANVNNFLIRGVGIADGRLHHIAATWTGDSSADGVKLYVDGNIVGVATALTPIGAGSTPIHFGWHTTITGHARLAGLIDEATIYKRALTTPEILNIINSDNAGKCVIPSDCNPDTTAPLITAPADITRPLPAAAGNCALVISDAELGAASATDNCAASVPVERSGVPANNIFPVGVTSIIYSATDAAGNTRSVTQRVTVVDNTLPAISCPGDIKVLAQCASNGSIVNYAAPAASDNCGAATVVCSPASGSSFPVGTTIVTCTATDAAGNRTACSFAVTVQSPRQAVEELIGEIELLGLPKGTENSLTAKLRAAINSIDDCSSKTAAHQLQAFINQVNALRGKELTPAQADLLIAAAQRIIGSLG